MRIFFFLTKVTIKSHNTIDADQIAKNYFMFFFQLFFRRELSITDTEKIATKYNNNTGYEMYKLITNKLIIFNQTKHKQKIEQLNRKERNKTNTYI